MTSRLAQWTLDVIDSRKMALFWSRALGYEIEHDGGSPHLLPPPDAPPGSPTVWLQETGEPKAGKNRNHPDLHVPDGEVDDEVERLIGLGATPVDVGQKGDEGFVVLADPEGNEFCLLYRRHPQQAG
ncbi:VOC family protein [Herbidospora daliensis]|uniref:VOC family protein n=1 Tax=Herbidospora daliensis TaxID=295585 RepID=UPI000A026094|nr:VOC family protein [Herbidospora daliensis]